MLDLFRRGSGLTWRKLSVYIRALPADAAVWASVEAERAVAARPSVEQIRERQRYYEQQAEEAP